MLLEFQRELQEKTISTLEEEKARLETERERLTEEKAGKTLCVIQEQGHVGLEGRCKGVAETFDKSEKIYVKGTDTANVQ